MYMVSIDADACSGCGECAKSCPADLLSMVEAKAEVTGDACECMGCQSCTIICPSGAIVVQEF
jgi:Pyruvate/2-oxoacid:ferredoxin oxidoreductase delta subunit